MVKEINLETIEVVEGLTDAIAVHIYLLLLEVEKGASFEDKKEGLEFLKKTYSLDNIKRWADDFVLSLWKNGVFVGFGRAKKDGWITHVYIDKDFQKQGIGTKILGLLERKLKENGNAELFLNSDLKALGFYKRHGWNEKNEKPTNYHGILLLPMVKIVKSE